MSEERRAALEAELEDKIQERIELMDEWADGVYSFDEARERDSILAEEIDDIQTALAE